MTPGRLAGLLAAAGLWALASMEAAGAALIQVRGEPLAGGRLRGRASVPLEKAHGGDTPVLTFRSGAATVRLLLDTGAASALVRPELAQRLGLPLQPLAPGAMELAGGGAECPGLRPRRTVLPTLRLLGGSLELRGLEALVLPVAALPSGIDGVLGAPSLRQLPLLVDPIQGSLRFGADALAPPPGLTSDSPPWRLPLEWRLGVPLLGLPTRGGRLVMALADTGAEGLFLSPALAARLPVAGTASSLRLVGFCGEQPVTRQRFAGWAVPGAPAVLEGIVTDNAVFRQLTVEAIAGQELLRQRRQRWRLDLARPHLELW
jgi:predicted aspartyl protease